MKEQYFLGVLKQTVQINFYNYTVMNKDVAGFPYVNND